MGKPISGISNIAVTVAALLVITAPEPLMQGAALFSPLPESQQRAGVATLIPDEAGITTVRSRLAVVDADQLSQARDTLLTSGTPVRLTLNLFDDATLQVVLEETRLTYTGGYSLLGSVAGADESTVALVVRRRGAGVSGVVRGPGGTYEVEALRDGAQHLIRQVEFVASPALGDDARRDLVPDRDDTRAAQPPGTRGSSHARVIDVMVLYTPQARRDLVRSSSISYNRARMVDKIERSVADMNAALRRTRLSHRIQLVFVEETGYFNERADGDLTLDAFRDNGTVRRLRDLYQADLVHLIVRRDILDEEGGAFCGLAYISTFSFTARSGITKANCLSPELTFPHELGHNLGLEHDPYANRQTRPPVTPWRS